MRRAYEVPITVTLIVDTEIDLAPRLQDLNLTISRLGDGSSMGQPVEVVPGSELYEFLLPLLEDES